MIDWIKEIRERCQKATPGPWTIAEANEKVRCWSETENIFVFKADLTIYDYDVEFISHAREDIPKLLDEVVCLREQYIDLEHENNRLSSHVDRLRKDVQYQRDKRKLLQNEVERLRKALEDVKSITKQDGAWTTGARAHYVAHRALEGASPKDDQDKSELSLYQFLRSAVIEFAKEMEKKLKENDHKVHWSECSLDYLINRLGQERIELLEAIELFKKNPGKQTKLAVIQEAADCGNFSMMIADNMKSNFHGKRRV